MAKVEKNAVADDLAGIAGNESRLELQRQKMEERKAEAPGLLVEDIRHFAQGRDTNFGQPETKGSRHLSLKERLLYLYCGRRLK
ncbi:MAG TPA: hypothetical protein VJ440_05940 [Candidatus Brocadiaceae bacterium]|nr:hypothetical protein [Candidatus Brocadiaceae bacterium]